MTARSKARKRALDILYAAEARGVDARDVLDEQVSAGQVVGDFAIDLVRGITEHQVRIDELLATHAQDWTLERMPAVDRAILRIGSYELIYRSDVPDAVVIDEAVEMAKALSTDNSPRFVNGVLGQLAVIAENLRQ